MYRSTVALLGVTSISLRMSVALLPSEYLLKAT